MPTDPVAEARAALLVSLGTCLVLGVEMTEEERIALCPHCRRLRDADAYAQAAALAAHDEACPFCCCGPKNRRLCRRRAAIEGGEFLKGASDG